MNRDEILRSIGFDNHFIECLDNFEMHNPEIVEIENKYALGNNMFIDSNNSVINIQHSSYYKNLLI